MATALYVQFRPERQPLFALDAQSRLCHKALFVSLRSVPKFPTASHKDNKAVPAVRSRSKKTKNRRKKGDDARKSVRLPCIVLHQYTLLQDFPLALLSRFCGMLARFSKSAGSVCVFINPAKHQALESNLNQQDRGFCFTDLNSMGVCYN
jgi:hypothetical protein